MEKILNYLIAAILAVSIFILFYLPIEFILTEIWMLTPKIPPLIATSLLIVFIFFLSFVEWGKILRKKKFLSLLLIGIIILAGFVYREWRDQKLERGLLPKIYSIFPPLWGIQGNTIEIKGKNFFPDHRRGKVMIGDQELLIESWADELVVGKQQVPKEFGTFSLRLIRSDGVISNSLWFEVKDPDELLNYY
ncbi:MAG TPA: IPT/TIG domain-containing protein [Patescibacteria group bacterium]|nr:IPT/TIG domain-containing protein [Patescibacteria group bacterium]